MDITEKEHYEFLQDCRNMKIYFCYKKQIFKYAESYNEEELKQYHKAYVILVNSYGYYSGSNFRIYIKTILDSVKSSEEKYNEYKNYIDEQIEIYNKIFNMKEHKQIRRN